MSYEEIPNKKNPHLKRLSYGEIQNENNPHFKAFVLRGNPEYGNSCALTRNQFSVVPEVPWNRRWTVGKEERIQ